MLTARENMRRTVKNENPERYVNQYEAIKLLFSPFNMHSPLPQKGMPAAPNAWGVWNVFPENTPGGFPVHTPEKLLVLISIPFAGTFAAALATGLFFKKHFTFCYIYGKLLG